MTVAGRGQGATLVEPILAVLAQRLEQPMARAGPGALGGQHRLVDQPCQQIDDIEGLDALARADVFGRGQVEVAGKHRRAVEHQLFVE